MGIFENFGKEQAVKLIRHYTGQNISPKFIASCDSSISPNWRGVVVLDNKSLWLVNRLGARGVEISNLAPHSDSGQYPVGSKGYPKYRFGFTMLQNGASFTIYPITEESGRSFEEYLRRFEDSDDDSNSDLVKYCDQCGKALHLKYEWCNSCHGTTFRNTKFPAPLHSENQIEELPEFKTCPMCAEEIKFAAKKCRFCQHMMDQA